MPFEKLEEKRMYQRAEQVADQVWNLVGLWTRFAQNTVGEQMSNAADSIGANIAEAGGRFHLNGGKKFLYYARGSLRETVYWIRRTRARALVSPETADALLRELEQLSCEINGAIRFQKRRSTT